MLSKNFVITENNVSEYIGKLCSFLKTAVEDAGANGAVLGLSGGLDSAVAALLLKRAGVPALCVILPDGALAQEQSVKDAMLLVNAFELDSRTIDIEPACAALDAAVGSVSSPARANIRPRARMTLLYALAQDMGRLVVGTGNLAERVTGYFTKWGDGGSDINPLALLTKAEVRLLAQRLGVPAEIKDKAPSAGLYEGQTDENDMGVSYEQIDGYLLKGSSGDQRADRVIDRLYRSSNHKRSPIPAFRADGQ